MTGKNIETRIQEFSDRIFQWVHGYRHRVFLFVLSSVFLVVFSFVPYINTILTQDFLLFLITSLALIIFKVSYRNIILMGIILIILAAPLVLIRNFEQAEFFANLSYGFLFLGVLKAIFENG